MYIVCQIHEMLVFKVFLVFYNVFLCRVMFFCRVLFLQEALNV